MLPMDPCNRSSVTGDSRLRWAWKRASEDPRQASNFVLGRWRKMQKWGEKYAKIREGLGVGWVFWVQRKLVSVCPQWTQVCVGHAAQAECGQILVAISLVQSWGWMSRGVLMCGHGTGLGVPGLEKQRGFASSLSGPWWLNSLVWPLARFAGGFLWAWANKPLAWGQWLCGDTVDSGATRYQPSLHAEVFGHS